MNRLVLSIAVSAAAIAACYTGPKIDGSATQAKVDVQPTEAAPTAADLPCDVAQLLADRCNSCHGSVLSGGAPNRLVTSQDLEAPSLTDPSTTTAELSLARMKDTKKPMPPDGVLTDSEVGLFEAWVKAGQPKGDCSADGADAATVCTSGQTWTRGDDGSKNMHPGMACNNCHSQDEGPIYAFAGTVYPTAHEPDDCYGANGTKSSIQVEITDANGKKFTSSIGSAGNFGIRGSFTAPYTARVIAGGKSRAMKTPQTDGDCNTCHTERGTEGAAGRITAP